METQQQAPILKRIRLLTWLIIIGLVFSGWTAIPLKSELDWLVNLLGLGPNYQGAIPSGLVQWLLRIRDGLDSSYAQYPFLAYGTDWLAFGHFVIAIAFIGALRDPVRNKWLFHFGMVACALVVPYSFIFGALRHIPIFWRLIDSSFGVIGFFPLWFCSRMVNQLERQTLAR